MTINEVRQLFDYTEWANELVLQSSEKLSEEQLLRDVGISHRSILGTLAHMAGAEWVWLERWHGRSPTGDDVWAPWTTAHCKNLADVRAKWQPILDLRRNYLANLSESELPCELAFR